MQTAPNLFNMTSRGLSADVQKIAGKWPGQSKTMLSSDDADFAETMAALMALPPDQLQNSLEQLGWVSNEGDTQGFSPLIDLSEIELDGEKTKVTSVLEMLFQAANHGTHDALVSQEEALGQSSQSSPLRTPTVKGNEIPSVLETENLKLDNQPKGIFKIPDTQLNNRTETGADLRTALKNPEDVLPTTKGHIEMDGNHPTKPVFPDSDVRENSPNTDNAKGVLNQVSERHLANHREMAAAATRKAADHNNLKVQSGPVDTSEVTATTRKQNQSQLQQLVPERNFMAEEGKQTEAPELSTAAARKMNKDQLQPATERNFTAEEGKQTEAPELSTAAARKMNKDQLQPATERNFTAQESKTTEVPELTVVASPKPKKNQNHAAAVRSPMTVESDQAELPEMATVATPKTKKAQFKQAQVHRNIEGQDLQTSDKNPQTTEFTIREPSSREGFQSLTERWTATSNNEVKQVSTDIEQASIPKEMKSDVIRQIVQRMSLRTERLQSKMNIKLKPEFLGNVRLQINTQNHLVSVRMIAESTEVKEIIEKNIQYLKTELQQHGLEIEKFDVLVGEDREGRQNGQNQTGFRHAFRQGRHHFKHPDEHSAQTDAEIETEKNQAKENQGDSNEISYFA